VGENGLVPLEAAPPPSPAVIDTGQPAAAAVSDRKRSGEDGLSSQGETKR